PGGLSQRGWPDLIELLSSFGGESAKLAIGQVSRQRERRQLGEPSRRLAFSRQVPVVLDLDLGSEHRLGREFRAHARGLEQRAERDSGALCYGRDPLASRERRAAHLERTCCLGGRDCRLSRDTQNRHFLL